MNMDTNFNIGKRIYELRVNSGLSQEKLALRANITPVYLGLLERNLKNPTIKVIEQICNQLDISLSDFFLASKTPDKSTDNVSLQIITQISDRTEEEKLLILQMIKDVLRLCDLSKNQALENLKKTKQDDEN